MESVGEGKVHQLGIKCNDSVLQCGLSPWGHKNHLLARVGAVRR